MSILIDLMNNESLQKILINIIYTAITLIILYIVFRLAKKVLKLIFKKNVILNNVLDEGKIQTINSLSDSIILFLFIAFGIMSLVYIWFGPISLGFATIAGVAIGVSVQNFIKDIISGLLIMIEDQFKVGDFIKVDTLEGVVTKLTLRSTQFRASNGSIHIIPNSLITKITNFSKEPIKITVELLISSKNNINIVLTTINTFCTNYENPHLVSKPLVHFSSLKETSMLIKVTAFSSFQNTHEIEQDLRIKLKKLIEETHIELI